MPAVLMTFRKLQACGAPSDARRGRPDIDGCVRRDAIRSGRGAGASSTALREFAAHFEGWPLRCRSRHALRAYFFLGLRPRRADVARVAGGATPSMGCDLSSGAESGGPSDAEHVKGAANLLSCIPPLSRTTDAGTGHLGCCGRLRRPAAPRYGDRRSAGGVDHPGAGYFRNGHRRYAPQFETRALYFIRGCRRTIRCRAPDCVSFAPAVSPASMHRCTCGVFKGRRRRRRPCSAARDWRSRCRTLSALNALCQRARAQAAPAAQARCGRSARLPAPTRAEPQFKYIPVRRLRCSSRRASSSGLHWAVFEPTGEPLRARSASERYRGFLHGLFQQARCRAREAAGCLFRAL